MGDLSPQAGFGFDHVNELGTGHSSCLGDADLADERNEPSRTVELNSEVSGGDHLRDSSRWLHEKTTAISD